MIKSKTHLIKAFVKHLKGSSRFLILGPCPIEENLLSLSLKSLRPDLIILVDGGTNHIVSLPSKYSKKALSVGDGDSSKMSLNFELPKSKDFSDLLFVLQSLKKLGDITKLELLGFSSIEYEPRADHLLFNLGAVNELSEALERPIKMDAQYLFLPSGTHHFDHSGIFSLLSLVPNKVKLTGKCQYQLKEWSKITKLDSRGLSNIGLGKIKIEATKSIILYFIKD